MQATFLDFLEVAADTLDDREEKWAYVKLKEHYQACIQGQDDRVPSFFDAMTWAAQELYN